MSKTSRKARRRGLRKGWMATRPPSPSNGAVAGADGGDGGRGGQAEPEAPVMIEEACLPWTPLPEPFSHDWAVDVVHLAETTGNRRPPGENLSIAVAAYSEPTATTPRHDAAWRIDFRYCQAYRKRILNYAGADPLTGADPQTRPDPQTAFWEIAPSRYLVESGVRSGYPGEEFHHYVIVAGIDTVYEMLAQDWHCTPLPQEWAKPFSDGPFPHW
jgi:hypothetical protein